DKIASEASAADHNMKSCEGPRHGQSPAPASSSRRPATHNPVVMDKVPAISQPLGVRRMWDQPVPGLVPDSSLGAPPLRSATGKTSGNVRVGSLLSRNQGDLEPLRQPQTVSTMSARRRLTSLKTSPFRVHFAACRSLRCTL